MSKAKNLPAGMQGILSQILDSSSPVIGVKMTTARKKDYEINQ